MKDNDSLTEKIINCCFKVHNELGPGFKERIYHNALELFLDEDGLKYETEKLFEVNIKGSDASGEDDYWFYALHDRVQRCYVKPKKYEQFDEKNWVNESEAIKEK